MQGLGLSILGGNATGIFVSDVKSAGYDLGIRVGDQILEVSNCSHVSVKSNGTVDCGLISAICSCLILISPQSYVRRMFPVLTYEIPQVFSRYSCNGTCQTHLTLFILVQWCRFHGCNSGTSDVRAVQAFGADTNAGTVQSCK